MGCLVLEELDVDVFVLLDYVVGVEEACMGFFSLGAVAHCFYYNLEDSNLYSTEIR